MTLSTGSAQRIRQLMEAAILRGWQAGLIAVWCSLAIGFTEVVVLLTRQHVLNVFAWTGREFIWMTPISYLFHLRWLCTITVLITVVWPRAPVHYVVVFPLLMVGAFSQFITIHQLHTYTVALLALGVALQLARWAGRHRAGFGRFVRWTTPALLGLLVLNAAALSGWRAWQERSGYASLPPARAGAPNVLLIILDTVRAASMSLYGYARPTAPLLERWSRRGVVFDRAVAPAPWTLPSHATLFTGYYPHELSTSWLSPLDSKYPTLAEVFRDQGYLTAGISSNHAYAGYETGVDRGFIHFDDYRVTRHQVKLNSSLGQMMMVHRLRRSAWRRRYDRKWAEDVNQRLLGWLDQRQDDRPFFVFLNYFDAHGPYEAPRRFLQQIGGDRAERQDRYDGAIARMDHYLGALLDSLDRRGALENTIVVLTSDHGELFGEHNLMEHGNSLYWPLLHVPLVVVWPKRIPAALRVAEPVTLRDVPATLVDLAHAGSDSVIPGHSLARFWGGSGGNSPGIPSPILSIVQKGIRTPPQEPVTRGDMWSLIEGSWHYIRNGDGKEELFDLADDPTESRNLVEVDSGKPVLERLRRVVEASRRGTGGGAPGP